MTLRHGALIAAALVTVAGWIALPRTMGRRDVKSPARAEAGGARQFWTLYAQAGEARSAGRLEAAVTLYRQALALRPAHEDSLYYLGNCLLERHEYDEAVRVYEHLVTLDPSGSSRGYMQLAAIHASLDPRAPVDLSRANELFRRALALDPDSGALLGLAEVALLQHRFDDASRLLENVEADNAMSIAAPYLRGYLAFAGGDHHRAWTLFQTAVSRGELKKGGVKWTEEGDAKASPELRLRALARQSLFGSEWMRLRAFLAPPGPGRGDMRREYERLHRVVSSRWP